MKTQRPNVLIVPYSKLRRFEAAAGQSVRNKQLIHGLLDIDVTRARALLSEHKARTGESLSFTAFLTTCLAKAIDEHKEVQAFRKGEKRLAIYQDVDICTRIERETGGEKIVMMHTIRAANHKTFRQQHDEIRAAQAADFERLLTWVQWWSVKSLSLIPSMLHGFYFWVFTALARRWPRLWKESMGTVGVTAVGMFANGSGWGIPSTSPTSLMMTIGGIGEKPTVVDGHIAIREFLSLTISVDHDIVDGAPAARFATRLQELIESGYGLESIDTKAAPKQAANVAHR